MYYPWELLAVLEYCHTEYCVTHSLVGCNGYILQNVECRPLVLKLEARASKWGHDWILGKSYLADVTLACETSPDGFDCGFLEHPEPRGGCCSTNKYVKSGCK